MIHRNTKLWMARDQDKTLWLFVGKPTRLRNIWGALTGEWTGDCCRELPKELYPEIVWKTGPCTLSVNHPDYR